MEMVCTPLRRTDRLAVVSMPPRISPWIKVVHHKALGHYLLRNAADSCGLPMGKDGKDAHRVSVTLTRAQHAELERIAGKNGVKVAWLVRRAVERLVEQANGGPLLPLDLGQHDAKR